MFLSEINSLVLRIVVDLRVVSEKDVEIFTNG